MLKALKKLVSIVAVVLVGATGLYAQSSESEIKSFLTNTYPMYYNNIGFSASFFSGYGFHYKRNIDSNNAIKAVFFGWTTSEESNYNVNNDNYINPSKNDFLLSFGLEYQYSFYRVEKLSLYGLVGLWTYYSENNYSYSQTQINNTNAVGLGIGCDWRIASRFVINADLGFTYNSNMDRNWYHYTDGTGSYSTSFQRHTSKTFSLAAGIGIGFAF
jgi:hypothetical protein